MAGMAGMAGDSGDQRRRPGRGLPGPARLSVPSQASEAGVWWHYRRTLLRIDVGARSLAVRLVPEDGVPSGGPWPFDLPVVVLTAWNPGSVAREPRDNALAQAALEAELRAVGLAVLPAEGIGEDSGWTEPSAAVPGLGLEDAVALGVRYGQRALYRLDAGGAEIIGCLDAARRERWPWRSGWLANRAHRPGGA
jgi:hypothetical protein